MIKTPIQQCIFESRRPNTSSLRCAVLGAGFAGLSVAWHLLFHSPKEFKVQVDIFDDVGIAGGASGVDGGLVHPYSPKIKPLWRADECWTEFLNLLNVAEAAAAAASTDDFIVRRTGILRPPVNHKILDVMHQNALTSLPTCPIQTLDGAAARDLIPNLCTPLNTAFFMPLAVNLNPRNYLKALFLATQHLVNKISSIGFPTKEITLQNKLVASLSQLGDEYDAVIVCLGARVDMLPELSGMLPLRTCRGIVAHLQLHDSLWSVQVQTRIGPDFRSDSELDLLNQVWSPVLKIHQFRSRSKQVRSRSGPVLDRCTPLTTKMTPFKIEYGRDPPKLWRMGETMVRCLKESLKERDGILDELWMNVNRAPQAMKNNVDKQRREENFEVGEKVFLRLQPYRQKFLVKWP
ncbi:uncharacterized protein LOC110708092 isoform X2 [Chenopodium quinoa]|uniref:uncharacterized protein LOC110708092 isoform X2 n=1 Tax=Chenopodium quinoa TaxID=63459 RepID=UPI000B77E43A|nr:uncharacterized protein LOC110708092 isoform X2 [Chenopodium quinoa]